MLVLLEACSGSAVELHLGQRSERFHPVWALHKNCHLKKFWWLTPVVLQVVTYVRLLCQADMCFWEMRHLFFPPRIRKGRWRKGLLLCPQKVWEGRTVSNLSLECGRIPLVCFLSSLEHFSALMLVLVGSSLSLSPYLEHCAGREVSVQMSRKGWKGGGGSHSAWGMATHLSPFMLSFYSPSYVTCVLVLH